MRTGISGGIDVSVNGKAISIIIPIHQRESEVNILRTIDGIEKYSLLPHNIILSGFCPAGIIPAKIPVQPSTRIMYLPTGEPRGDARNYGADFAIRYYDTEYVCFCDANLVFDERSYGWDVKLIDYLKNYDSSIVSPTLTSAENNMYLLNVLLDPNESPRLDTHHTVPYPEYNSPPEEAPALCGCLQFMPSSIFKASIFGFLPGIPMEDYDLCLRLWTLGYNSTVVPSCAVSHIYRSSYLGWEGIEAERKADEYYLTKLLFAVINFDSTITSRVFSSFDCSETRKRKIWDIVTSDKWQARKEEVIKRRIRSTDEYYKTWKKIM